MRAAWARNTTSPSASFPVCATPRCFCSRSSAALVAQLNSSDDGSSCERLAYPRSTRSRLSCSTSRPVTSDAVAPSARLRYAGARPYSSTTGFPSTRYSTWPWRTTRPAPGNQVYVPLAWLITVSLPVYPSVPLTLVRDDSDWRVTAASEVAAPLSAAPPPARARLANGLARPTLTPAPASATAATAAASAFLRRRGAGPCCGGPCCGCPGAAGTAVTG